jgi:FTR1 family protein
MDALVITAREGIEAALVIGIMVALLGRIGRRSLIGWVVAGAASAGILSIGVAAVLTIRGLSFENPAVEGAFMFAAAVAVITVVWWMLRAGRGMRAQIEERVSRLVSSSSQAAARWALFALSFLLVAREGVETALLLGATAIGDRASAGSFIGAVAGLALAGVYGVVLALGGARLDLRMFFRATSVVLAILALQLVAGSVHEFEEAGVIPMTEALAHFFDAAAETTAVSWLFFAAVALPFLAPLVRRGPKAQVAHS